MPEKNSLLRRFLLILSVECCAALVFLLALPAEGGRLSPARLALAGILLVTGFVLLYVYHRLKNEEKAAEKIRRLSAFLDMPSFYALTLLACGLIFLASTYVTWFFFVTSNAYYLGILLRLMPFVFLAGAASLEGIFFFRALRGTQIDFTVSIRQITLPLALFLAQVGLGVYVLVSRVGLTRDNGVGLGWGDPGTPILSEQVTCVVLAGLLAACALTLLLRQRKDPAYLDAALFLLIWGLAAVLWLGQPLRPNYFAPPPRAPNYEYYPYSDAGDYDRAAQSLLAGSGLGGVVKRPLYSLFLAGLHALSGGRFSEALSLQVIALAILPALLYLMGRKMGSRLTGFLVAGFVIVREMNALALSGEINVSHVRLTMSDVPSAAGIVLLAMAGNAWLSKPSSRLIPLLNGGILGLLMLVRSQTLLLAVPLLILMGLEAGRRKTGWIKQTFLFFLGLGLALTPWILRNYTLTGRLAFEESGQLSALARRYSVDPASPGESEDGVISYLLADPGGVAAFGAEHFLHNWVSARFILPVDFRLVSVIDEMLGKYPYWQKSGEPVDKLYETCCSLSSYVKEDVPYWQAWNGTILPGAYLPLLFSFALSAAGLAACWRRFGFAGLLPAGFFLAYAASCALIRSSGWRYILPVDWVILLYYAAGISAVLRWIGRFLGICPGKPETDPERRAGTCRFVPYNLTVWLAGGLILLAGCAIPLAEALIPPRYPTGSESVVVRKFPAAIWKATGIQDTVTADALEKGEFRAMYGRALYPKVFAAGEDEPWYSDWKGARTRFENEADFLVIGSRGTLPVVLPLGERTAVDLPHSADVFVLGAEESGVFWADIVLVLDGEDIHLLQSNHISRGS